MGREGAEKVFVNELKAMLGGYQPIETTTRHASGGRQAAGVEGKAGTTPEGRGVLNSNTRRRTLTPRDPGNGGACMQRSQRTLLHVAAVVRRTRRRPRLMHTIRAFSTQCTCVLYNRRREMQYTYTNHASSSRHHTCTDEMPPLRSSTSTMRPSNPTSWLLPMPTTPSRPPSTVRSRTMASAGTSGGAAGVAVVGTIGASIGVCDLDLFFFLPAGVPVRDGPSGSTARWLEGRGAAAGAAPDKCVLKADSGDVKSSSIASELTTHGHRAYCWN